MRPAAPPSTADVPPASASPFFAPSICPRCGYDLSGACGTWTDACPLQGVCAECGLAFPWSDVLNADRAVPSWFFEHVEGARAGSFVRTVGRSLRPWAFWSNIRLGFAIRVARLWVPVFLWLLVVQVCLGADLLALDFLSGGVLAGSSLSLLPPGFPAWSAAILTLALPYTHAGFAAEFSAGGAPWFAMSVLMFLGMPLAFLALPTTLRRCRVRRAHLFRIGAYSMIGLPVLTLVLVGVKALLLRSTPIWAISNSAHEYLFVYLGAMPLLAAFWLGVFWWFGCRLYLKLPQATGVVGAMVLVAFLFGAACVGVLHPNFLSNPVTWWFFW